MPITTIDPKLRELGRLRAGEKRQKPGGKPYPAKLNTFRLTSPQKGLIEEAAGLWGGTVTEWTDEAFEGVQWQVTLEAQAIPVVVVGAESFDQWNEKWAGGFVQRRCDGVVESLTGSGCLCDPDPDLRECVPVTRMNVLLPDISDLGQWRLEAGSYYAAVEMKAFHGLLVESGARFVRAWVRLEPRTRRVMKNGSPVTRRFNVPVIEARGVRLGDVLEAMGLGAGDTYAIAPGSAAALDAGDREPPRAIGSVPPDPAPPPEDEPAVLEEALRALVQELGESIDPAMRMPQITERVRRLYRLMEEAGMWPRGASGLDALHLALEAHYDANHLGDLRKDRLVEFAEKSWEAARAKLGVKA